MKIPCPFYKKTLFPDITSKLHINNNIDMTLVAKDIAVVYQDPTEGQKSLGFIDAQYAVFPLFDRTGDPNTSYDVTNVQTNVPISYILRLTFITSTGKTVILSKSYPIDGAYATTMTALQAASGTLAYCNNGGRVGVTETIENSEAPKLILDENPISEDVNFTYILSKQGETSAQILNIMGQSINQVTLDGTAGEHKATIKLNNGSSVPNGMYLLRLEYQTEKGKQHILRKVIKQ